MFAKVNTAIDTADEGRRMVDLELKENLNKNRSMMFVDTTVLPTAVVTDDEVKTVEAEQEDDLCDKGTR